MNLKKMMTVAAMAAAGVLLADVSVEDVKCTQRYPWNGLVDIEYTIACDDPEAEIYVNPVGFNGDTGLTVFPTHFTGDGATNTVKAGKHTMVWDAKADMGNLFSAKNFQIKMYAGKKLSRYIVIDISGGTEAEDYPVRHSIEGPNLTDDTCRTTEIWMRLIPPGTFMMGSPEDELGRSDNEDLHKVTLTQPYYMGVFEVTQRQWELVMGNRPSRFSNDAEYATRPVESVTYAEIRGAPDTYKTTATTLAAASFLGVLRTKTDCSGFDLPTESQWENACRVGSISALNNGANLANANGDPSLNLLGRYYENGWNGNAWSESSSTAITTARVGSFMPNAYGLYDMHGNVSEWCLDGYKEGYRGSVFYETDFRDIAHWGYEPLVDPFWHYEYFSQRAGDYQTDYEYQRVLRGGSWYDHASYCRSAGRRGCKVLSYRQNISSRQYVSETRDSSYGFRVCCMGNLL